MEIESDANNEWEVMSAKTQLHIMVYKCCPEPYYKVDLTITVKRRSPSYHAVLFTPAASMYNYF